MAIKRVWGFSKLYLVLVISLRVLKLIDWYILIYLNSQLMNKIVSVINSPNLDNVQNIYKLFIVIAVLTLCFGVNEKIIAFYSSKAHISFTINTKKHINKLLSKINISIFDDPHETNKMRQALIDFGSIEGLFLSYCNLFFSIINLFTSCFIVLHVKQINYIVIFFIILFTIPVFFIAKREKNKRYQLEMDLNTTERQLSYFSSIFFSASYAKELRLYQLEHFFQGKFDQVAKDKLVKKRRSLVVSTRSEFFVLLIQIIFGFITNLYVFLKVLSENMQIGDFTYISGIFNNVFSSTNSFMQAINEIIINKKKVKSSDGFFEKACNVPEYLLNSEEKTMKFEVLEFKNVSFKYPNTDKVVLNNVSFKITKGEKIALVGTNGSGKSTLIKLILRFYTPTEGEIFINGIDVRNISIEKYNLLISSMFQENTQYALSLFDNIHLSDVSDDFNIDKIEKILNAASLSNEANLNRMLKGVTKLFDEDGTIFSVGQLQKMNIAKAMYRNADLYVFDEPSASLDTFSEEHIFDSILTELNDKTVILISHRLANLKFFDRILVIKDGDLIENGNHSQLVNLRGEYYNMYINQFNKY